MGARVVRWEGGHRLSGGAVEDELVNRFLGHLVVRGFSPATVRAYAFDLANFVGFLADGGLTVRVVRPGDLFSYLDWQTRRFTFGMVNFRNYRIRSLLYAGKPNWSLLNP